ncbi:Cocaine esterase [Geodia barretti]|uniref:Cocaine esterase n=1 Tax=Geodia barretti TaxID=519541 RepID=A0AA35W5C3_GEOBA|nr:Cocaine esterase [Geodia barretti]
MGGCAVGLCIMSPKREVTFMPAELMGLIPRSAANSACPVRMRDGVTLYADVYRPDVADPLPVLLQRTPYDKFQGVGGGLDVLRAASHGYAVVIQDTRGRYASEGEFYPFLDEPNDGYDTVAWAARLAWGFALSWTMRQLTMANMGAISSRHDVPDGTREGLLAAFNELDCAFRHQPIVEMPHLKEPLAGYFYDWIRHSSSDEYWKRWRIEDHYPHITTPALHMGGWHDIFLLGTLRNFVGMRKQAENATTRDGQRLIVGPWHHGPFGETSGEFFFGLGAAGGAIDTDGVQLRWFDHWLKGEENGANSDAPVRIFVMGANEWRSEQEWPLARTQYTDYYLHSEGKANTASGDGGLSVDAPEDEAADVFLYDPRNPAPTRGGALCCGASFVPGGAYDQQDIEARNDVLCYTTPPLSSDWR